MEEGKSKKKEDKKSVLSDSRRKNYVKKSDSLGYYLLDNLSQS